MREATLSWVLAQEELASVFGFFCLGTCSRPCCLFFTRDFLILELSFFSIQLKVYLFLLLGLSLASDCLQMDCVFRHSNSIIENVRCQSAAVLLA